MSETAGSESGTDTVTPGSGTDSGGDMDGGEIQTAPEWLPEKFAVEKDGAFDSAASFQAVTTSYAELEKKIGASKDVLKAELMEEMAKDKPETPADYGMPDWESTKIEGLPEGVNVSLEADDPMLVSAQAWAHKNNVSKEAFNELVTDYVKQSFSDLPDVEAEMKQLGDDAQGRINRLEAKLAKNLPEKQYEGLVKTLGVNASLVESLELLTKDMEGVPLELIGSKSDETREDVLKMMDSREYRDNDPQTHRKVQEAWARLSKNL